MYQPELDEVVEPAGSVVPSEDEHGILVHARHVAETLVRRVTQSLHLFQRNDKKAHTQHKNASRVFLLIFITILQLYYYYINIARVGDGKEKVSTLRGTYYPENKNTSYVRISYVYSTGKKWTLLL